MGVKFQLFCILVIINSCGLGSDSNLDCVQYEWEIPQSEIITYKVVYSMVDAGAVIDFQDKGDSQYELIKDIVSEKEGEANMFIVLSQSQKDRELFDVSFIQKQIDPLSLEGEYRNDVFRVTMDQYGNITQKQLNTVMSNSITLFLKLGCFSKADSSFTEMNYNAFTQPTWAATLEVEVNNVVRVTEVSSQIRRFRYDFRQQFSGLANSDTIYSDFALVAFSDYELATKQLEGFYGYVKLSDYFDDKHEYVLGLIPISNNQELTDLHYSNRK